MIEVKNLHKSFGDVEVLKGISTVFEKGKNQPHYWSKWFWKNGAFKVLTWVVQLSRRQYCL